MYTKKIILLPIFLLSLFLSEPCASINWDTLSNGLELGRALSPLYEPSDSAYIHILRIDPAVYSLHLMNASHPEQGQRLTAREWARQEGFTAVINAAMFQRDFLRSVSFMKSNEHTNNSFVSRDKSFLAFDPLAEKLPEIKIIDRECDDFDHLRNKYGSMVQSIRMLSCTGRNVWQKSERRWSIASVGLDSTGNLLFFHATAPHSVNEFIDVIKDLPISLKRAMYMEGGSQAQLFIQTETRSLEFIGNYSSGGRAFTVSALPNVLGIMKKN
ncbi:hypothetical protein CHISP_0511 [Chitinispirillum alkaliphilum]|nr:hypothetical protein CHISP_0511 [Chitinispirillum alkaliphilum]